MLNVFSLRVKRWRLWLSPQLDNPDYFDGNVIMMVIMSLVNGGDSGGYDVPTCQNNYRNFGTQLNSTLVLLSTSYIYFLKSFVLSRKIFPHILLEVLQVSEKLQLYNKLAFWRFGAADAVPDAPCTPQNCWPSQS